MIAALVKKALQPGKALKSLYLSLRYAPASQMRSLPIVSTWRGIIRADRSSRIHIGRKLVLGRFVTRIGEIGQMRFDRTIVQLGPRSNFRVDGTVTLGPGVRVLVGEGGELRIGDGTFISSNSSIKCRSSIMIGHGCAISWEVDIMDTDFHILRIQGVERDSTAPVQIGNHVWIGSRVTILKGVTIGDGAVIAAGAVVTQDVPPGTLFGGVPARLLREGVEWAL